MNDNFTLSFLANHLEMRNAGQALYKFLRDMGYKAPEVIAEDLPPLLARWERADKTIADLAEQARASREP